MKKILKPYQEFFAIYEMAVAVIDRQTNTNIWVENPATRNNKYFKFGNNSSWNKATKLARISLLKPVYLYHTNTNGVKDWELTTKEKRMLVDLLMSSSKTESLTNWQKVLGTYNQDNYSLPIEDWISDNWDKEEYPDAFTKDFPMPDYMLLEFDRKKAKNL